jgi:hypothetical protein
VLKEQSRSVLRELTSHFPFTSNWLKGVGYLLLFNVFSFARENDSKFDGAIDIVR